MSKNSLKDKVATWRNYSLLVTEYTDMGEMMSVTVIGTFSVYHLTLLKDKNHKDVFLYKIFVYDMIFTLCSLRVSNISDLYFYVHKWSFNEIR